jgi:predicted ArsR family transcriptional regulator
VEHVREDVEEILFRLAERAEHEPRLRARIVRGVRIAMRLAIAERRATGGERVLSQMTAMAQRWARWRAPRLAHALSIDVDDAGDLGRIQDWEDRVLEVQGHWVRRDRDVAIKHETVCPFADLATQEPRFCTELVHTLESETFRALNPTYRLVPLGRLLSKGDPECVFRHEVGGSDARGA